MEKVEGVRFKNGIYDIDLAPVVNLGGIVVDGEAVPGSLKVPSNLYSERTHTVALLNGEGGPLLMHTNLELVKVDGATYTIDGYGHGTLRFTGVEGKTVTITDPAGQPVAFEQSTDDTGTYLQVRASGQALDVVWK